MVPTQGRFRSIIWQYYRKCGRRMPWRRTRDPYRILVSEIMLQQTQVARVVRFYPAFIKKFPDFRSLAQAKTADVLRAWQGMGYNRRALALQRLSRIVLEKFNGRLPHERAALVSLPGIGEATTGALRAFAWNEPEVFIETNIRRVFIHFFFPKHEKVTDDELRRYIKRTLDRKNPREWYWALMDYGAMLGGVANPNRKSAHYRKQPRFSGSDRELRGKILQFLLRRGQRDWRGDLSIKELVQETKEPAARVKKIVNALAKEGFMEENKVRK